jgi:hypothetical protein
LFSDKADGFYQLYWQYGSNTAWRSWLHPDKPDEFAEVLFKQIFTSMAEQNPQYHQ